TRTGREQRKYRPRSAPPAAGPAEDRARLAGPARGEDLGADEVGHGLPAGAGGEVVEQVRSHGGSFREWWSGGTGGAQGEHTGEDHAGDGRGDEDAVVDHADDGGAGHGRERSEEHTSELQSRENVV